VMAVMLRQACLRRTFSYRMKYVNLGKRVSNRYIFWGVVYLHYWYTFLYLLSVIVFQEEEQYLKERDRYELEKGRLIRDMKRLRDEDGPCFNNFQILHHRYALLNLLGKGGFSEVYKEELFLNLPIIS
jgi:hypothetical protein